MKSIRGFYLKIFCFWRWNCLYTRVSYLNRHVFVMHPWLSKIFLVESLISLPLIWIFASCTCSKVRFLTLQVKHSFHYILYIRVGMSTMVCAYVCLSTNVISPKQPISCYSSVRVYAVQVLLSFSVTESCTKSIQSVRRMNDRNHITVALQHGNLF